MNWSVIDDNILLGGSISNAQFDLRHRIITFVLAVHTPVLFVIGLGQVEVATSAVRRARDHRTRAGPRRSHGRRHGFALGRRRISAEVRNESDASHSGD